jgi:VanZ family protein
MQKKSLLFVTFWLALLVFILHYIGLTLYFYWTFWWYDFMTHFIGGLTIGVLIISLLRFKNKNWKSFLAVFVLVFATGVAWEIFEYVNDLTNSLEEYKLDVIFDLIMDSLGAITAYFLFISRNRESF